MRMMGILGRGVLVAYCHQDIPSAAALIFPLIFFSCFHCQLVCHEPGLVIVSPIGKTDVGSYSLMPYVYDETDPVEGDMCATGNLTLTRERAWGGVVVRHLSSRQEFCVVPGTFLHDVFSWGSQFPDDIDTSCATKPVLFLVDTNAEPDSLTFEDLCRMQNVCWGTCSDPGVQSDATCCDDI